MTPGAAGGGERIGARPCELRLRGARLGPGQQPRPAADEADAVDEQRAVVVRDVPVRARLRDVFFVIPVHAVFASYTMHQHRQKTNLMAVGVPILLSCS